MASVLREFIGHILAEAAFGPKDMPEHYHVEIKKLGEGYVTIVLIDDEASDDAGLYVIAEAGIHPPEPDDGECAGAWIISSTHSEISGWGPLVYDIAIEWATLNGPGLAPDRKTVSGDAYGIWDYYLKRRKDVRSTQMSPEECSHSAAAAREKLKDSSFSDPSEEKRFLSSPLTKYYSKAPTTINALKKMGKIRMD